MEQLVIKKLLEERLAPDSVCTDELMSRHTTFRIGGPASVFVTPKSEKDLVTAIEICRSQGAPYFILGNGSNLLVSDQGYDGVVVHIGSDLRDISVEGTEITAKTGAMLSQVAHAALAHGLTGMEFAAGIPGSLGGACMMNAGAYGGEMSQILVGVRALDDKGQIVELAADQLELGYRHSIMMEKQYVVLGARIHLEKGNPEKIQAQMDDLWHQIFEEGEGSASSFNLIRSGTMLGNVGESQFTVLAKTGFAQRYAEKMRPELEHLMERHLGRHLKMICRRESEEQKQEADCQFENLAKMVGETLGIHVEIE